MAAFANLPLSRKLLYSGVAVVLLLGAVEVVLRITTHTLGETTLPSQQVREHIESEGLVYDPVYGWVRKHLPDPWDGEDANAFRRQPPIAQPKPPGGWRAFTFGDSQTYGAGLQWDQAYTAVAERALQERAPDHPVEFVNTGLSGYGSLQALRLIDHKIMAFSPDLLVIDCFPFDQPRDDVLAASPRLGGVERLLFHWRTWYVLRFVVERGLGRMRPM